MVMPVILPVTLAAFVYFGNNKYHAPTRTLAHTDIRSFTNEDILDSYYSYFYIGIQNSQIEIFTYNIT